MAIFNCMGQPLPFFFLAGAFFFTGGLFFYWCSFNRGAHGVKVRK